jgi:hypothetical protein
MVLRLPLSKTALFAAFNVIWWTLPFGVTLELIRNLPAWAPNPDSDSVGIVVFPMFAIWFLFWPALNVILVKKSKSYPAGASIFAWNKTSNFRSWVWSILSLVFIAIYLIVILDQIAFDREHGIVSWGIYVPLALFIMASLHFRVLLTSPESPPTSGKYRSRLSALAFLAFTLSACASKQGRMEMSADSSMVALSRISLT